MATWRAKCWLGSSVGYQELEVQANTVHGAKQQLERVYGAEQIINLHEVRNHEYSSSDSGDVGGYLIIGAGLFVIWLVMKYWWIILPLIVILGLVYFLGTHE